MTFASGEPCMLSRGSYAGDGVPNHRKHVCKAAGEHGVSISKGDVGYMAAASVSLGEEVSECV